MSHYLFRSRVLIFYIFLLVNRNPSESACWGINANKITSLLQVSSTLLAPRAIHKIRTVTTVDRPKDLKLAFFCKAPTKGKVIVRHSQFIHVQLKYLFIFLGQTFNSLASVNISVSVKLQQLVYNKYTQDKTRRYSLWYKVDTSIRVIKWTHTHHYGWRALNDSVSHYCLAQL